MNDNTLSDTKLPRLSILFKLGTLQNKGCRTFYQTLQAREVAKRSTTESEMKWHMAGIPQEETPTQKMLLFSSKLMTS